MAACERTGPTMRHVKPLALYRGRYGLARNLVCYSFFRKWLLVGHLRN